MRKKPAFPSPYPVPSQFDGVHRIIPSITSEFPEKWTLQRFKALACRFSRRYLENYQFSHILSSLRSQSPGNFIKVTQILLNF